MLTVTRWSPACKDPDPRIVIIKGVMVYTALRMMSSTNNHPFWTKKKRNNDNSRTKVPGQCILYNRFHYLHKTIIKKSLRRSRKDIKLITQHTEKGFKCRLYIFLWGRGCVQIHVHHCCIIVTMTSHNTVSDITHGSCVQE